MEAGMRALINYLSNTTFEEWWSKLTDMFNKSKTAAENPVLSKNLEILENRLRGAIHFLKKNTVQKNDNTFSLNYLPWFLLLGSPDAGKSTLLANSQLPFLLGKEGHQQDQAKASSLSGHCDWWVTQDFVLVDVPGCYITSKENKVTLGNQLWTHFLTRVRKWRGKQALMGVIVAISLEKLMQRPSREQFIADLERSIKELRETFGQQLSFYFTITKCDLIPGFSDFFSDCSKEELVQPWGVTLPALTEYEPLTEVFVQRFNALIKRLNKQLIWRLHQEKNPYAKLHIKDFPMQMERVKEAFAEVLKGLTAGADTFQMKGVYLTSATQQSFVETEKSSHPETLPAKESQQSFLILRAPEKPRHAYFIKQFLQKALVLPDYSVRVVKAKKVIITATVAASLMVASSAVIAYFFLIKSPSLIFAAPAQHQVNKANLPLSKKEIV